MKHARFVSTVSAAAMVVVLASCNGGGDGNSGNGNANGGGGGGGDITIGFVTNGVDPFWTIAQAGADQAGVDLDCNVKVLMPPNGTIGEQNRMLEELVAQGVDGVAVSPISGEDQNDKLNEVAEYTNLITHDSDAPNSDRLVFIGVDNYEAGRMAGELMKEALPDGGEIMIFIGRLEQDNARLRTQGVIDELLDRSHDPTRWDEPGETLVGEKFTILDVRTDNFDSQAALAQAEDALARYPDIDGMVGLFAYNPPAILNALNQAGKLGQVKVVGFDEQDDTLRGILDGTVQGTVVQDPYMYGYRSVEVLHALANGDDSVIPESQYIDIPARKITRAEVEEFWADKKEKLGEE